EAASIDEGVVGRLIGMKIDEPDEITGGRDGCQDEQHKQHGEGVAADIGWAIFLRLLGRIVFVLRGTVVPTLAFFILEWGALIVRHDRSRTFALNRRAKR